jgi:CheY-like chemotaxis protein
MIGYVLVGVLAGIIGAVLTLILGRSLFQSFLAYITVGTSTTVLIPTILYILDGLANFAEQYRFWRNTSNDTDNQKHGSDRKVGAMQILAVDDDPFIRELIPKIAAKAGFDFVTTAACGEDALRLLRQSPDRFGCILLDIHLPGMDGIELCRHIRQLPAHQDTPVFMLTAMAEEHYLNRAFEAGASDYTTKPFDVIGFAEQLRSAEKRALPAKTHIAPVPVFRQERKARKIS